ncbi:DUF5686 family protein [Aquirufa nivalisilvae]
MAAFGQKTNAMDSLINRALELAPQHSALMGQFSAEVITKEKGRFNQVLGLAKNRLKKNEGIQEGQWYGNQTHAKVYVKSLNQMIHEVIDVKGFQKKYPRPTLFFWPDFYQDFIGTNCVSPLNYHGRDYYSYDYQGDTLVDGQIGYQFNVRPSSSGDRLFSGKLTLSKTGWIIRWEAQVESDALLYHMDLQHQWVNQAWLPKSAYFKLEGGLMGNYGEFLLQEEVQQKPQTWKADSGFQIPNQSQERLNIAEIGFDEVFATQLLGNFHQSLLRKWKSRPQSGLVTMDSVRYVKREEVLHNTQEDQFFQGSMTSNLLEASIDTLRKSPFSLNQLLFSKSFYYGPRQKDFYPFEIYYKSPVFDSNFNTVEGFVANAGLVFRKRWARYRFLEAEFLGRRSFGLNRNTGYIKLRYKTDSFDISSAQGDFVQQMNPDNSISPEMNSLSTLLLKNNQMKIYRKEYWNLALTKRFSSKFFFKSSFEWSRRSQMDNTTDYYWFNYLNRKFTSNNPQNEEYKQDGFQTHNSFISQITLGFRPFLTQYYRNHIRESEWGSSPLILFKYRAGWKGVAESSAPFTMVELSYLQNMALSPWVKSGFIINAGTFIGEAPQYFIDFKHYNGTMNLVQAGEMLASHRLVGYYQNFTSGANQRLNVNHYAYSTAGAYVEGLSLFQFSNLWLKPILGMKKSYVKELLIANTVYIHNQKLLYSEVGYGLDGLLKIFRLEAIGSFINGQFNYVGLRLNLNSRIRIGNIPD